MKLAASNIAWKSENDNLVYQLLKKYEYSGIEIAPTRLISETPYDYLDKAKIWRERLNDEGFVVPSMQSIWYGRNEKLFGSLDERNILLEYTKKAINFAEVMNCKNLVFGCPRNRVIPEGHSKEEVFSFFYELGEYASEHNTVLSMEANPPRYNTNFINTTAEAIELIKEVNSKGFMLNLDLGTMIDNKEKLDIVRDNMNLVNHIHISEPGLALIERRDIHTELAKIVTESNYAGFVSVEMGCCDEVVQLDKVLEYVGDLF